ncbi:MAG: ATP phosphoribosyltransferase regulatory subunit [Bacillota bacterium]|jgi:ATP phosphoribosyltransferase regulatory subunit
MMWKLYIPDGEQDILADAARLKRETENAMIEVFRHGGFEEIVTPALEFYDSFSGQRDIIPEENMMKLVDGEGRILVLRPDLTVPCARVAATKLRDVRPLKFFYCQNVFRSKKERYLDLKEITQAGCEIIGDPRPDADAEIIATAIESLLKAGLKDFTVELGQVNYFKGLMNETELPFAEKDRLRHLIDKKDFLGLEQRVDEDRLSGDLKKALTELPALYGDVSLLKGLRQYRFGAKAKDAIENLSEVVANVAKAGYGPYLAVDLGMVSELSYYTGVIFQGFAPGFGTPILSGGRYDHLVEKFGEPTAATGFSVNVDFLLDILGNREEGNAE